MSIMTIVMIVSFVIIAIVIGLTIWITNKAYEVLPEINEVDPLPKNDFDLTLNHPLDESMGNDKKGKS